MSIEKKLFSSLLYALLGAGGAFILVLSESRVSGNVLILEEVLKSMLLGGVSANFGIWILFPVDSIEEVSKAEISGKEDLSRMSKHLQSGINAVSSVRSPRTRRYLKDKLKFTFQKWAEKVASHPEFVEREFERVYADAIQVGLGDDLSRTTKEVAISNPEFLAAVANNQQVSQKVFGRVMIDKDVE